MTVKRFESVHQLRYSRLCNVLPIMDNLGHPLRMSMIGVHLVMVVHRVYLRSRSLELMHLAPAQYIYIYTVAHGCLDIIYIVDLDFSLCITIPRTLMQSNYRRSGFKCVI